jgi:hypothetical protein
VSTRRLAMDEQDETEREIVSGVEEERLKQLKMKMRRARAVALCATSHSLSNHVPIDQPPSLPPSVSFRANLKPEPSTRLLSLRLRPNSRSAICTLDLDGNEALLTNYAANKRELTAIKAQPYFSSLPTMCMIIARHLFCGLLEATNR